MISYDRAKFEKVGDFFALTWLIFAGPVTFIEIASFVRTIPTKCLLFIKIAHFVRTIPTKCLIFIEIADFAGTIPANQL